MVLITIHDYIVEIVKWTSFILSEHFLGSIRTLEFAVVAAYRFRLAETALLFEVLSEIGGVYAT